MFQKIGEVWDWTFLVFSLQVPYFGALHLSSQAKSDFGLLSKVGDLTYLYNFRYYRLCQN
jgi:hypothetical protein